MMLSWTAAIDALNGNRRGEVCAELQGLKVGSIGELRTADPRWKSDEVLNSGAAASLSSRSNSINDQSLQSFRGRIDCSGQPRRARAHDDQIIQLVVYLPGNLNAFGHLGQRRPPIHGAIAGDNGDIVFARTESFQLQLDSHVVDIEECMRHMISEKELSRNRSVSREKGVPNTRKKALASSNLRRI